MGKASSTAALYFVMKGFGYSTASAVLMLGTPRGPWLMTLKSRTENPTTTDQGPGCATSPLDPKTISVSINRTPSLSQSDLYVAKHCTSQEGFG